MDPAHRRHTSDEVTASVLAATRALLVGFVGRYAAAADKVKKEVDGPVKVIDTGDAILVVGL